MSTEIIDFERVMAPYEGMYKMHIRGVQLLEDEGNPTNHSLEAMWREEYKDNRPIIHLSDGLLGIMTEPRSGEHPDVLVSVDIDEIVRDTSLAVLAFGGFTHADTTSDAYDSPFKFTSGTISNVARGLLAEDMVKPVADITEIHKIMQDMRAKGAYIVGNTSTLEACESSTFRFIQRYLPDGFDGFAFPRNFDGNGEHTKASVKNAVYEELHSLESRKDYIRQVLFIDDSLHHIDDVRQAIADMGIAEYFDVTPRYSWNSPAPEHYRNLNPNYVETPLEGFKLLQGKLEEHVERIQR